MDLVLSVSDFIAITIDVAADEFQNERRYEFRYPEFADILPSMIQGYDKTRESARVILEFIGQYHSVNPWLAKEIEALLVVQL